MSTEKYWEWRYLADGTVAHALNRSSDRAAICGISPVVAIYWFGTGSQLEYERAASLPRCKHCVSRMTGSTGGRHG